MTSSVCADGVSVNISNMTSSVVVISDGNREAWTLAVRSHDALIVLV